MKHRTKVKNKNDNIHFSQKHPRFYRALVIFFLLIILSTGLFTVFLLLKYIALGISSFINWLGNLSSKIDAVVIVALITGTVSLIGVIISSIVAKRVEYRKTRETYLAQKREKSYSAFIEMFYKIQRNINDPDSYSQEDMLNDAVSFSQELTLWGSKNVVKKWVKFRENSLKPDSGKANVLLLEEIMNEMRYDMGVKKVKKGDLLSFFINDVKQSLKKKDT